MNRYQTILCALDLGDGCRSLIETALAFDPATLRLLHVCEHPITGFGESTGNNLRVTEAQIRQQAYPQLSSLAAEFGITALQLDLLFGDPVEIIHSTAKAHQCDLIIIGSECKRGLRRLLGSTSSEVIHGAPCDILTVNIEE